MNSNYQIVEIKVLAHQEKINNNIFRAYDIRGIYPSDFNEEAAYKIGAALAYKIKATPKAVVGMDGRLSNVAIKKSLINGLMDNGIEVTDCGMLPTPMLYFATKHLNIPNGFMITGSHNPRDYNGIKMVIDNNPLFDEVIYSLRDYIKENEIDYKINEHKPIVYKDILSDYINRINKDINIDIEETFVVDCMNGVTGTVIKDILDAHGIKASFINYAVDGNFPNCSPDPTKEVNLEELKKKVQISKADYGVAFDGDGDRLVIIEGNGSVIWPDELMVLFSNSILKKKDKGKIVFDVKCTRNLKHSIEKSNGIAIESKTGHSYIKQKIKDEEADLGGELSGHIFFNDKWYGFDDGIYVFLRFVEILSNEPNLIKELSSLPKTFVTPEIDVEFPDNNHFKFMTEFKKNNSLDNYKLSYLDGIKISNNDSWALVRASNTSPKITLRFESISSLGLKNIQNDIKNAILEIDNTLDLPF